MKEQPTFRERIERRFKEREEAHISFPKSQEEFVRDYPELSAVWEEWFPHLEFTIARAISGILLRIADAGGWGELTLIVKRDRVADFDVKTSSRNRNGRRSRAGDDDEED